MNTTTTPRARKADLTCEEIHGEVLAYDELSHQVHRLNRTAALVWQHSDGGRSVDDIAEVLGRELGVAPTTDLVHLALKDLKAVGLIESDSISGILLPLTAGEMMSRRKVAAYLLPVVVSIVAPEVFQARSSDTFTSPSPVPSPTPTPTPSPTPSPTPAPFNPTGTFNSVYSVVRGAIHVTFIQLATALALRIAVTGTDCTISAQDGSNFVPVSGTCNADLSFSCTGTGTVAGRQNVRCTAVGRFVDANPARIECTYVMGANNELPTEPFECTIAGNR